MPLPPDQDTPDESIAVSRPRRKRTPSRKFLESMETHDVVLSTNCSNDDICEHEAYHRHQEELVQQVQMNEPVLFALKSKSSNPDTLHLHEAMKEPDADSFIDAIVKEINGHSEQDHWEVVPIDTVPEGTNVIPVV